MTQVDTIPAVLTPSLMTPEFLLADWQGHRRLTRRVIEAFPEDQLFTFTPAPPMRTFGELAWEMYGVAVYTLEGLVTDGWTSPDWSVQPPQEKAALLAAWDGLTARLDAELPTVPPARYGEDKALAWGTMSALVTTLYAIDNEIHHRGQGYVYLRALGIEPPPFYER